MSAEDVPVIITVDTKDVDRAAARTKRALDKVERKSRTTGRKIGKNLSSGFKKFREGLSSVEALVGVGAFGLIAGSILKTNMEFQSLTAQLKTFLGSAEKAKNAFKAIQAFAAPLPLTVSEVTQAFNKMLALGLKPTERAMLSFGNIAAGTGKDLMQFVEAVADAATGEMERLKEFGIKASQQGDKVAFTFQGITKTVRKNATEITEYLKQIGETAFAGALADQAKTVKGAISELGSEWDKFADFVLSDNSMQWLAESIKGLGTILRDFRKGLILVSFGWDHLWLSAEATWLEFYASIAPGVDALMGLLGKQTDGMRETEIAAKRLAEINKEIQANAIAGLAAISEAPAGKLDDFVQHIKPAVAATKNLKDSAAEAKKALAAQDNVFRLLNPDTAAFTFQIRELDKALEKGYITQTQYAGALAVVNKRMQEVLDSKMPIDESFSAGISRGLDEVVDSYGTAADAIADSISSAFKKSEDAIVTFVETGKLSVKGLVDSIMSDLLRMSIQQQIMKPIAGMMGGTSSTGASGDSGSLLGSAFSGIMGLLGGMAEGGTFKVGSNNASSPSGGRDNRLVAFRARDGEQVTVTKPGERQGGTTITMTVVTQDADSFKKSEGQIMARMHAAMGRAARRNA